MCHARLLSLEMEDKVRRWADAVAGFVEKKVGGSVAAKLHECPTTSSSPISPQALLSIVGTHALADVAFFVADARQTEEPARKFHLLLSAFDAFQAQHMAPRPHPPVGWDTAVLVTLLRFVHEAARAPGALSEEAIGNVVRSFRRLFLFLQTSDTEYRNDVARRRGALAVLNGLLAILLIRNNTHQCRAMITTVEQAEVAASGDPTKGVLGPCGHMVAEVIKYQFTASRIQLFDGQPQLAFNGLRNAFGLMPPMTVASTPVARNKLRVAFFWLAAGVLCGVRPPLWLLKLHPELDNVFGGLFRAFDTADLAAFDAVMQRHARIFRLHGIYFLLLGARQLCVLAALKRVVALLEHLAPTSPSLDSSRVPLSAVLGHFRALSTPASDTRDTRKTARADAWCPLSEDALSLYIARLVTCGAVKGYLAHEHVFLVLSRKDPFPPPQC